jgi:methionyl-tRNA formyltransferase
MRIVFMGTSKFAIPIFEKVLNTNNEIIAVYTKKPKKGNRGKIQNSPVYEMASQNNLNIYTPLTFRNGKNIDKLKELKPDLAIVVGYGLILPKELIEIPRYSCINVHPSLLPRWRGCAPMERCLMSDDTETGVCIMKVDEGIDSGDIISIKKIPLDKNIDIEYLQNTLSEMGAEMILDTIGKIEKNGYIDGVKQDDNLATFSEKITSKDFIVNWKEDGVVKIHKKIMALGNYGGIVIEHNGNKIRILKSDYIVQKGIFDNVGGVINKNFFIQCVDGILKPLMVQREGRKVMNIKDFLNGYRVI